MPATFHAPSHILTVLGTAVVHAMQHQHLWLYGMAMLPPFPINMYDPHHENSGVAVLQIKVQFKKMTTRPRHFQIAEISFQSHVTH